MEKVYYKGKIGKLSDLGSVKFNLGDFYHYGIDAESDKFLDFLNTLDKEVRDEFIEKIQNADNADNDGVKVPNIIFDELKKYINRVYSESNRDSQEIIFEIITTKNGDLYGKELHTGLLFPIVNSKKIKGLISPSCIENAVEKDNEIFWLKSSSQLPFQHKEKYIFKNYKSCLCLQYNIGGYLEAKNAFYYLKKFLTIYTFNLISSSCSFENLSLCETIILEPELINNNEVEAYLNRFQGFMKKARKDKFIKKITTEYNKNVFDSEIELKEPVEEVKKEKVEKDQITLKLENIEYLLMLLKQKNKEMYDEILKEYNQIINSEKDVLTLTPISMQSLTALEGKIEFYLNYSKNTPNNILEVLSNLKNEYLDNFRNDDTKTTKLTIKDIDTLNECFLKIKNEYLVVDQLQILKDIAFLYIMEIKEDDTIKLSDLKDSYFEDNLKYIMIVIMSLIEEDIIQDNILINLSNELDSSNIYNIIKNIEFKKEKQKVKK